MPPLTPRQRGPLGTLPLDLLPARRALPLPLARLGGIGGDRGESFCHLLVANQHGQDRIDLRWIERCPADIAQVAR